MPKLEKWRLTTRRYGHTKVAELYLYPELDCSSCVDDVYPASGEEQLRYYVDYIRRSDRYVQWWNDDAVPIYWSVMEGSTESGFGCEQAPFHHPDLADTDDVLTHYYPPTNLLTGAQINWYTSLPVINRRFPQLAKALGWLPAPGQLFAPLRSIINGAPSAFVNNQHGRVVPGAQIATQSNM